MSKVYSKIYFHKNFKNNQKRNKLCFVKQKVDKPKPKPKPVINYSHFCFNFNRKKMDISVLYEDETEGEFDLNICCPECSALHWNWSRPTYEKVISMIKNNLSLKIPNHIITEQHFIDYLKNI